jgi:hypothetical protein
MLNAALMSAAQPPLRIAAKLCGHMNPPGQRGQDIFATWSIAAELLVNLLKRPGVISPRGNLHFECPTAITQTNWSKGIPYFRERPRSISDDAFV